MVKNIEFIENLVVIFLKSIKQTIDLEFFIDRIIALIENQRMERPWKKDKVKPQTIKVKFGIKLVWRERLFGESEYYI